MTMQVDVVSPEKVLFKGSATLVRCRTVDGDIAFLTGHAPFLGALGKGEFEVLAEDGERTTFQLDGGFVEVKDDHVILLTDSAS